MKSADDRRPGQGWCPSIRNPATRIIGRHRHFKGTAPAAQIRNGATRREDYRADSTDITHQMLLHSAELHEQLNDMFLTARACDIQGRVAKFTFRADVRACINQEFDQGGVTPNSRPM